MQVGEDVERSKVRKTRATSTLIGSNFEADAEDHIGTKIQVTISKYLKKINRWLGGMATKIISCLLELLPSIIGIWSIVTIYNFIGKVMNCQSFKGRLSF